MMPVKNAASDFNLRSSTVSSVGQSFLSRLSPSMLVVWLCISAQLCPGVSNDIDQSYKAEDFVGDKYYTSENPCARDYEQNKSGDPLHATVIHPSGRHTPEFNISKRWRQYNRSRGLGQLTYRGSRELIYLGVLYWMNYVCLIEKNLDRRIFVESSYWDRNYMSAATLMYGFYNATSTLKRGGEIDIYWHLFPIRIRPLDKDNKLLFYRTYECPKYKKMVHRINKNRRLMGIVMAQRNSSGNVTKKISNHNYIMNLDRLVDALRAQSMIYASGTAHSRLDVMEPHQDNLDACMKEYLYTENGAMLKLLVTPMLKEVARNIMNTYNSYRGLDYNKMIKFYIGGTKTIQYINYLFFGFTPFKDVNATNFQFELRYEKNDTDESGFFVAITTLIKEEGIWWWRRMPTDFCDRGVKSKHGNVCTLLQFLDFVQVNTLDNWNKTCADERQKPFKKPFKSI